MKNFIDLVEARQSCRNYAPVCPTMAQLVSCVEAARLAPSACNSQPWHFYAVNDPELAAQVGEATRLLGLNEHTRKCQAFIVVCERPAKLMSRLTAAGEENQRYAQLDVGIAVAHLVLAAKDQGMDTCIMGCFDEARLRELLQVPAEQTIRLVLAVGYACPEDEVRAKKRLSMEDACTCLGK